MIAKSSSSERQYPHLEWVALRALEQCGAFHAALSFISDTGNIIFQADTPDRSFCVRVYPDASRAIPEIQGELDWLLALRKSTNLIVPEPVKTTAGHFVQEISAANNEGNFRVVIFHWIPGEIVGERLDATIAKKLGGLMAELHEQAAGFTLRAGSFRDDTDWQGMGHLRAGLSSLQIAHIEMFLDKDQITLCDRAAKHAASIIAKVDTQQNFGLIHSDLHANNCLLHHEEISIIDFDDCQFAPFTCDIAITLSGFDDFADPQTLRSAFLQGYAEKRVLSPTCSEEIEAFVLERRLRLIRWISTWPSVDHFSVGKHIIANSLLYFKKHVSG